MCHGNRQRMTLISCSASSGPGRRRQSLQVWDGCVSFYRRVENSVVGENSRFKVCLSGEAVTAVLVSGAFMAWHSLEKSQFWTRAKLTVFYHSSPLESLVLWHFGLCWPLCLEDLLPVHRKWLSDELWGTDPFFFSFFFFNVCFVSFSLHSIKYEQKE